LGTALKHFSLSVAGSAAFVLQQLTFFIVAQRLVGESAAGELAVAWALSAPVFLLFTSGVRLRQLGQGTAGAPAWRQLDVLRAIGAAAGLVTVLVAWYLGFRHAVALSVLAGVLLQRVIDLVGERDYTVLQAAGHADRAGAMLVVRSVAQAVVGVGALLLGASLPVAVVTVAVLGGAVHLGQRSRGAVVGWGPDHGPLRASRHVVVACLAFGGAGALASASINGPRLAIGRVDPAFATEFSNLVLPFTVVSLASTALGVIYLPKIGEANAAGDRLRRAASEGQLVRLGVVIAVCGALFSVASSIVIIPVIVGPSFLGEGAAVGLTAVALFAAVVGSALQDVLTGRGRSGLQPVAFGASAVAGTMIAVALGPSQGVVGAVIGLLVGASVQLVLLGAGVIVSRNELAPCGESRSAAPSV
jgi:O-antigen/teichoic acid export membrane protein